MATNFQKWTHLLHRRVITNYEPRLVEMWSFNLILRREETHQIIFHVFLILSGYVVCRHINSNV